MKCHSNLKCVTRQVNTTRTRLHDARKIVCMKLNSEHSKNKCLKPFPLRARWNFNNTHMWTNNQCIGTFKICYRPYVNNPQICPASGNPYQKCIQVNLNKTQQRVIGEAGYITCMREPTIYNACWKYGTPLYSYTEKSVGTSGQCQGAFRVCYEEYERNEQTCPDPSSPDTCENVRISGPQRLRIQRAESISCIKMMKEFSKSRCWRQGERKYYYEGFNVWSTNGCDLRAKVCYTPFPAGWSSWGDWSLCSVSCGESIVTRYRECKDDLGANSMHCPGSHLEQKEITCGSECPLPAGWSSWGEWSLCSVSCGESLVTRYRECKDDLGANSMHCPGSHLEQKEITCGSECPQNLD